MGKAKRFNTYDEIVKSSRERSKGFGQSRQNLSGVGSTFRASPLPPIITTRTSSSQGVSAPNEFRDDLFRIFDDIDPSRKLAFQTGGITTATTRTVTAQNADGTMMLIDGTGTQIVTKPTEIRDSIFKIVDDVDGTKKLAFQTDGIAASTTRTWTAQNASGTVALLDGSITQSTSNQWDFNSDVNLGNDTGDLISIAGRIDTNLIPTPNATRDIGTPTGAFLWRNLHVSSGMFFGSSAQGFGTSGFAGIFYRVALADSHDFRVNDVAKFTINNTQLRLADQVDIIFDTSTGTEIGSATNQKFAFWGTTPIVQPTHISDPSGGATVDSQARTAINAILAQMATTGLQAAS